jgi:YaiO family outer membrane protein
VFIAAVLAAALAAAPSPSPSPSPAATATPDPYLDVETGWVHDQLTGNRAPWNDGYLDATLKEASGVTLYGDFSQNSRFSQADTQYNAGIYLPTDARHSNLMISGAVSPQRNVLPADEFDTVYDLRAGGGYGCQVGFDRRNYTGTNVSVYTAGADDYFGMNHLVYTASFAALNNVPGIAFSQSVQWSIYRGQDKVSFTAAAGRDVESTGIDNGVAVYKTLVFDFDDLHWLDRSTAVHFGVGYDGLTPDAYDRLEVRLGLRERF